MARRYLILPRAVPMVVLAISRYKETAALLRTGGEAAPVEIKKKLVTVDCEDILRNLLRVTCELWKGALQWVNFTLSKLAGEGRISRAFHLSRQINVVDTRV